MDEEPTGVTADLGGEGAPSPVARRLGSQTLVVLAGNVFTLVVGLPLQVYVSRVLGAGGLGTYGLLEGAVNTANGFLGLGLAQTAVRYVPHHLERREHGDVRRLLRLCVTTALLVGGLAYALLVAALPYLGQIWPELAAQAHVAVLMGLLIPLGLLIFLLQQSLRGFQEIRYMILGSSIIQLSVKAAATVAVFAIGLRLSGYVLATVAAHLVGVLWMAFGVRRKLGELPREEESGQPSSLRQWVRYAAISYSSSLIGSTAGYLDRFLLGAFVGSGAVGVLVVLRQLQQFPQVFAQMLLMVGTPMIAAAHARNDAGQREHLYVLMTDWMVKASLPLVLFLLLFATPLLSLFGPQFAQDGAPVFWLFVLAQIINVVIGPVGNIALMSGLESAMLRLSAINTVMSVVLLAILAPTLGLLGIAVASVVNTAFIKLSAMLLVRGTFGLRWWDRRFIGWLLPSCAACAVGLAIDYAGLGAGAIGLAATLAAMYAAFVAVVLLQGVNEEERDLLHYLMERLFGRRIAG
jgi:O-antigen/teichoic acid export membrane protein